MDKVIAMHFTIQYFDFYVDIQSLGIKVFTSIRQPNQLWWSSTQWLQSTPILEVKYSILKQQTVNQVVEKYRARWLDKSLTNWTRDWRRQLRRNLLGKSFVLQNISFLPAGTRNPYWTYFSKSMFSWWKSSHQ